MVKKLEELKYYHWKKLMGFDFVSKNIVQDKKREISKQELIQMISSCNLCMLSKQLNIKKIINNTDSAELIFCTATKLSQSDEKKIRDFFYNKKIEFLPIIKCNPAKKYTKENLESCKIFINYELLFLQPKKIIALGDIEEFLETKTTILSVQSYDYIVRNPSKLDEWIKTIANHIAFL